MILKYSYTSLTSAWSYTDLKKAFPVSSFTQNPPYTILSFIIFWVKNNTNKHIIWNSLSMIYWIASTVQIELTNETPWTF